MNLAETLLIALALAMDAFAVSLAAGALPRVRGPWPTLRMPLHFGFFQSLMAIAGWLVGHQLAGLIAPYDHWVAFGLLAVIGVRMIRSGGGGGEAPLRDPSRGLTLIALSFATSIDALAVGLGLAVLGVAIWFPSLVIGVITIALSVTGVLLGRRLGTILGQRMEIVGGIILILIGVRILIAHLWP